MDHPAITGTLCPHDLHTWWCCAIIHNNSFASPPSHCWSGKYLRALKLTPFASLPILFATHTPLVVQSFPQWPIHVLCGGMRTCGGKLKGKFDRLNLQIWTERTGFPSLFVPGSVCYIGNLTFPLPKKGGAAAEGRRKGRWAGCWLLMTWINIVLFEINYAHARSWPLYTHPGII